MPGCAASRLCGLNAMVPIDVRRTCLVPRDEPSCVAKTVASFDLFRPRMFAGSLQKARSPALSIHKPRAELVEERLGVCHVPFDAEWGEGTANPVQLAA